MPIFLLEMAQRELAGGCSIWFFFLAISEEGQMGEVFSREEDEHWLYKGSQGPGPDVGLGALVCTMVWVNV